MTHLSTSGCDLGSHSRPLTRLPAGEENATNDRPRRDEVCLVMAINDGGFPLILAQKLYAQPSAFTPEKRRREACRQKRIAESRIPEICVLDPDGNVVRGLLARGETRFDSFFSRGGIEFGIIGCVAGAPSAEPIAEDRFASGCKLEKGEADGSDDALQLIAIVADRLRPRLP